MADKRLLLENQICFRVYALERALMATYKPLLRTLGITYPQYLVLLALWEHQSLTIGQICDLLSLDTGTISPLVKRMEVQQLVIRTRLPEDERTVQVQVTEKGRALEKEAISIPETIGSCMFSDSDNNFDIVAYKNLQKSLDDALAALTDGVRTNKEIPQRT